MVKEARMTDASPDIASRPMIGREVATYFEQRLQDRRFMAWIDANPFTIMRPNMPDETRAANAAWRAAQPQISDVPRSVSVQDDTTTANGPTLTVEIPGIEHRTIRLTIRLQGTTIELVDAAGAVLDILLELSPSEDWYTSIDSYPRSVGLVLREIIDEHVAGIEP